MVAFGLCAYVTLRYTLKPLGDVSDSAAAISPRSLHARLQTKDIPTEITPLVDSFNRVLERLERGVPFSRIPLYGSTRVENAARVDPRTDRID